MLFGGAEATAHTNEGHSVLIKEPQDPPPGIDRLDLQPRCDVLGREKMGRCQWRRPRTLDRRRASELACGRALLDLTDRARRHSLAASFDPGGELSERSPHRILRLDRLLHRRLSHAPAWSRMGRNFSSQGMLPLPDARGSLAKALHTMARDPRASSLCNGVKPATDRPKGAGAIISIGGADFAVNRAKRNNRG
ncbi:hypothetical protein D3M59_02370 [Sphingomonas edaphi]|uniref:Uncharacterized protein n=1 Tax=Sphingomonas edaphi TaxID=2315689 RepID=A0A418Q221_9SPHN|nr:hypothetical protein D3M59_02370 [Sphingomonas edaphi]